MVAYLVLLAKAVVDLRYSRSLARERDPDSPQHKIYLLGGTMTMAAVSWLFIELNM